MRALVEGFARELDLEESFQEALGITPADFDREFLQELDRTLKPLVKRMQPPAVLRGRAKSQSRDEYLKSLLEAAEPGQGELLSEPGAGRDSRRGRKERRGRALPGTGDSNLFPTSPLRRAPTQS